jgi:hypothetical protein
MTLAIDEDQLNARKSALRKHQPYRREQACNDQHKTYSA